MEFDTTWWVAFTIIVVLVTLFLVYHTTKEPFTSVDEKAKKITQVLKEYSEFPKYKEYIKKVGGSDVVEYHDIKDKFSINPKLATSEDIKRIITQ